MKKILIISLLVLLCINTIPVSAVPADSTLRNVTQPDGTFFEARLMGDEFYHWIETSDGYPINYTEDGWWVYETGEKFSIKSSEEKIVGKINPETLFDGSSKKIIPPEKTISQLYDQQTTGDRELLVILVEFSDIKHKSSHTPSYYNKPVSYTHLRAHET